MSKSKRLTSEEIVSRATDILREFYEEESLTAAEIVMLLDTAKMIQVQKIILELMKDNQ